MTYEPARHVGRLLRLMPERYRGLALVHWSMAVERRSTGWLDPLHHARQREWLCHALARHRLMCPAYTFMPDHAHFLWIGWSATSDQRLAVAGYRRTWNADLRRSGRELQRQPYENVLREADRRRDAFAAVAGYIFQNPVRAGLAADWRDWPYAGALVPGYPELDPRADDYWERFWKVYAVHVERPQS